MEGLLILKLLTNTYLTEVNLLLITVEGISAETSDY